MSSAASPRGRAGADERGGSWGPWHVGDMAQTPQQDGGPSEASTRN